VRKEERERERIEEKDDKSTQPYSSPNLHRRGPVFVCTPAAALSEERRERKKEKKRRRRKERIFFAECVFMCLLLLFPPLILSIRARRRGRGREDV